MGKILDGRRLAGEIRKRVKQDVAELNAVGYDVGLAVMLIGVNPASVQYFNATLSVCRQTGITAHQFTMPDTVSVNEIMNVIHVINADERINGLLILMPLPRQMNTRGIINALVPEKDVDGLGAISVGRLAADESSFQLFRTEGKEVPGLPANLPSIRSFLPCTPFGVIRLLEYHHVPVRGAHAVIIGKSLAVGKPLANMFLAKEATVTVCHRETKNLAAITRQADILCSATGRTGLIKGAMVKKGAVVVDIGINVLKDGSIVGDVDFASVSKKASFITPVPGGVGPVTISMLLENTVRSAQRNRLFKNPVTL